MSFPREYTYKTCLGRLGVDGREPELDRLVDAVVDATTRALGVAGVEGFTDLRSSGGGVRGEATG
jgi:hypothetical protein